MSQIRYLTKSKFKLGMQCPTKLFYTGKPEYANAKIEDTFLRSLASGGFQVGALARCYFPEGTLIETPNDEVALTLTESFLKQEKVTLFEAVFRSGPYQIRADVVVKDGDTLNLYEVKAGLCDIDDQSEMLTKKGAVSADWRDYIEDVAFQKFVISLAHPELTVKGYLMLTDKRALCPTDGLNQKFKLVREEGRRRVQISDALTPADLATPILRAIDVDATCDMVLNSIVSDRSFPDHIAILADHYCGDKKFTAAPSKVCGDCEFRLADGDADKGLRSGFRECWSTSLNWTDADFEEPTVLDIWDHRKKDEFIQNGKIKFSQIALEDLAPKPDGKPGISRTERQWKQVEMVQLDRREPWIDRENLRRVMDSWTFPLHFIDFETCAPAIPFKQQRRPYEGVLFQFSHHTIDADGRVTHAGQFLCVEPGRFPNYECVRELKRQLASDNGTIFRYAAHENSYLCTVYDQLRRDPDEIPDRDELCEFIKTITNSTSNSEEVWTGSRTMVDMLDLVKRFHYDPRTNGSNSLKYVLPATLNSSLYLRDKYSQPIYGTDTMPSLNFKDQAWVVFCRPDENGQLTMDNDHSDFKKLSTVHYPLSTVRDPYSLLPRLFTDESEKDYAAIMELDRINDGGAAMTAYAKLQFEDIPPAVRAATGSALLKYCELDTLAMVMLYEAWKAAI